ncbi:protein disulfide-isomerase-like protein [Carex littledalei]|uniref:Protein disulfide-isomerase n=1 Tax=Carex littledalei TaxID=544730 RepID=A0A833QXT8_9POAL|nr:protein disulfide-isomerase-like protein [Carex littledalei]
MAISKFPIVFFLLSSVLLCSSVKCEEEEASAVIVLDNSNFTEVVEKHDFIVVEFYAPWCGHCKKLAPEYEKAAQVLSKHNPPIVLAKVDGNEKTNKPLTDKFNVKGYPTLIIIRNKGEVQQEYTGPRQSDGIVKYLKTQAGPASFEIKSEEDAKSVVDDKSISIVGVFSEFSGTEFDKFTELAEKLRSDYTFAHTKDAKILPHGDSSVEVPFVRLFKPFDELFSDYQEFEVDALEKFIEAASIPLVVTFDSDESNRPYILKFFQNPNIKAMFFTSFTSNKIQDFKTELHKAAVEYKSKNISFLLGDPMTSQGAFQFYGLKDEWLPLFMIQDNTNRKYLSKNVEPDQITSWIKGYLDGTLTPYKKSQPIPETNDMPIKIVVGESFNEFVFESGKNVLLEFYAPWCVHCKKLDPMLEEIAVALQNDESIIIAKMDATLNDVPDEFEVSEFPTLYFFSADKKREVFKGGRTVESITNFIKKHKFPPTAEPETTTETEAVVEAVAEAEAETVKDEL